MVMWRPRTRVCICSVYASTGVVAERVTVPVPTPPSEEGEFRPDPEEFSGSKVMFTTGASAVDPVKDISGTILDTIIN